MCGMQDSVASLSSLTLTPLIARLRPLYQSSKLLAPPMVQRAMRMACSGILHGKIKGSVL
jgi:hypothetical protein